MDPWSTCQTNVTISEIVLTKFEDNFIPGTTDNKLPDSEQYLAILEEKLKKLKNDPKVLAQLTAKKEYCMQQLLAGAVQVEEAIELEETIPNSSILRTIAPQKQALTQGEIVEFIKYDQLKDDDSDSEVNRDCRANRSP
ncbi:hypothetical protein NQ315_005877 [Exocentrus adspersus]|uniref:Uncharacterized protein n=1 Tax=Exocentrus adspersus TaxID=1586481 RepID=A0AAV8VS12_9CUCU|nr:hypothetical protein NQ315_005877 [Exocentrus adspersus]